MNPPKDWRGVILQLAVVAALTYMFATDNESSVRTMIIGGVLALLGAHTARGKVDAATWQALSLPPPSGGGGPGGPATLRVPRMPPLPKDPGGGPSEQAQAHLRNGGTIPPS